MQKGPEARLVMALGRACEPSYWLLGLLGERRKGAKLGRWVREEGEGEMGRLVGRGKGRVSAQEEGGGIFHL